MALPELNSYNLDTLGIAQRVAIDRYKKILTQPADSFLKKFKLKRHMYWSTCAAATLTQSNSANEICRQWSLWSKELITEAWDYTQPKESENPLALFAVGKLGAEELNLSSDIDLMVISKHPPTSVEFEHLRKFRKILNDTDEFGFCFRVDFDLRPGGRFGPVINSLSALQDYLWEQAALWERIAFVRFQHIAGSEEVGCEASEITKPFAYRKYLDYSLYDEFKKLRPNYQKPALDPSNPGQYNLKLGVGGIRDVELYINSLQVIHGGKQTSLQTTSTSTAIEKLIEAEVLNKETGQFLTDHYWQLRLYENKTQSYADQQTHTLENLKLPADEVAELIDNCKQADQIVSGILGQAKASAHRLITASISEQKNFLESLGFDNETVESVWTQLIKQVQKNANSEQKLETRSAVVENFLIAASKTQGNKRLALHLLLDFLTAIRAKSSFFNLLNREQQIIEDLAYLFSLSPYLGGVISSRPEIIDNFIFRQKAEFSDEREELLDQLIEYKLINEVASSLQFLKSWDVEELSSSLTASADFICDKINLHLQEAHNTQNIYTLALGKWGGMELGARSDLDFIFVTDKAPTQDDHRFARNFMTCLTSQARGGRIYEIDLRLRPSGSAGPMLVQKDKFNEFLASEIPAWQKQSYLRSRWLGKAPLDPVQIILSTQLSKAELSEIKEIRGKLLKPMLKDTIDLKLNPGGLVDTELAVQTAMLQLQPKGLSPNTPMMLELWAKLCPGQIQKIQALRENYTELRQAEQLQQMTQQAAGSQITNGSRSFTQLAQVHKTSTQQLFAKLSQTLSESKELLKDLDPIHSIE